MADGMRILYVDDEEGFLDIVKLFLERDKQFSVDTFTSAFAAMKTLESGNYDAILSDYQMPEMNGIEFLKKVRASNTTIPFIIFTGRGREDVVIEALNNGADFYLQKGGDPDALYKELMHVIRQTVLMRRTQMTLAEQEQRYHDLQNANDLIQSVAPDGYFLFVNKKWLDTLGYEENELYGLTIFDVIHEESLQHCMETFRRVISGENVGMIDAAFKTRDGKKVYVEGMANCKIGEGACQYTRGIFKDVTDRKLAEAALRESEARYRNVVEDQTEFICRFRPDGTHVFVNDAYCRYYNTPREDLIGKRFSPEIPDEDRALITQHLASLTPEHPVAALSNRVILKDGRIRWQQWSNRAIFDDSGHVLEYQSVGRDITDLKDAEQELLRKNEDINAAFEELTATEEELRQNYDLLSQKEQALRESEETFRAMVEQSGEGIIIVDFFGMLQFANRRAWDIIEYPEDRRTALNFNVLEIISPELRENAVRDFLRVSKGIDSYPVNYKIITPEKKEKWIECIGKKISYKGSPVMLLSFRDVTERRRTDCMLQENEEKFRTIFENSPYPISINTMPDGRFMAVNAAFLHSSGYSETEVLGKTPVELGLLSLMDFGRLASRLLLAGKLENVPMVLMGKGGIRVHVLFSVIPVTFNNQPAILTVTAEITKLKRIEEELLQKNEELQASEEIFRKTFENSALGMTLALPDFRFLLVNPAWLSMMGYTEEEFQKMSFKDITHPDDLTRDLEGIRALEAGILPVYSTEKRYIRKDGSTLWGALKVTTVRNHDGTLRHYLAQIEDITPRKQAEEAVRESEEKLALVMNGVPTLISYHDSELRFVYMNKAHQEWYGRPEKDLIGKSLKELLPEDVFFRAIPYYQQVLGGREVSFENLTKDRDGRDRVLNARLVPHIRDKQVVGFFASLDDVTGRKAAEAALQAMFRSMVGSTGLESLKKITENVSSWLGADCVIIGEIQPDDNTVKVLSMLLDGKEVSDFSYALNGTPCGSVVEKGFCLYPDNVIDLFPESKDLVNLNIQGYVGTPLRNSAGRVMGILCVLSRRPIRPPQSLREIMDIIAVKAAAEIERMRIMAELLKSEERFRMLLQHVPSVAVQGYNMDGITQYWNDASAQLYGYTSEEAVGKNLIDLIIPPEMRDEVGNAIRYMAESGQPIPASELSLMKKDGSRVAVFSSHAIVKRSGGTQELFCIDIDLTDRKRAEEALRESQQMLAEAMDLANLVNWEYDVGTGIFTFNDQFYTLYGTTAELEGGYQMSAKNYAQKFVYPEDLGVVAEEVEKAIKTSDPHYMSQREHRIIRRDGEIRDIVVRIRLVKDAAGRTVKTRGANQDITERKRMEEALRHANAKLSMLNTITRHDILNQLTILRAYIHLLKGDIRDPMLLAYLEKEEQSAKAIQWQIEFTRDYQDIGAQEPDWQVLSDTIGAVIAQLKPTGVEINVAVAGVEIFADRLMEKVFYNLMENSLRHGEHVTSMDFAIRKTQNALIVSYCDNGVGITAEDKKNIFEKGFGKHTGLGLFLSKEILSITGMTITENGEPGKGARFEITVPKGTWRIPEGGRKGY